MRIGPPVLAALLAGCAAGPASTMEVKREETLLLRPGAEATLRVDCPPGLMAVSAKHSSGDFAVTESRPAEPGVWWVTFANPTGAARKEEISIRLFCR